MGFMPILDLSALLIGGFLIVLAAWEWLKWKVGP